MKKKKVICRPKLGHDGFYRVIIETYYHPPPASKIGDILEKVTKLKWEFFGCFMDHCCFATKQKPPKEFTIKIDWEEYYGYEY